MFLGKVKANILFFISMSQEGRLFVGTLRNQGNFIFLYVLTISLLLLLIFPLYTEHVLPMELFSGPGGTCLRISHFCSFAYGIPSA